MLLITSIFFHSPAEKFSGFLSGVLGAYTFKLGAELLGPFVHGLWAGASRVGRGVESKQAVRTGTANGLR